MRLPDSVYRALVVLNTTVLLGLVLAGLLLGISRRDRIAHQLGSLVDREFETSRLSALLGNSAEAIELPTWDLQIKADVPRDIDLQVRRLGEVGVMTDDLKVWHPARFRAGGEQYRVKVRLRGDLAGHWNGAKKSWRVRFRERRFFEGRRTLDLIKPDDKRFETEQVAYEVARELGLLVPDAGFAHVRLNGMDYGAYFWMEPTGPEMLERQGYPAGEIFSQRNVWLDTRRYGFTIDPGLHPGVFDGKPREPLLPGPGARRWSELLALVRDADDATFEREIELRVDLEKYLAWNALTWMFGSWHSQWGDNLRWYYDPTVGLFEPILYDIFPNYVRASPPEARDYLEWNFERPGRDPLADRITRIPRHRQRRNERLWELLSSSRFDLAERLRPRYASLRSAFLGGVEGSESYWLDRHHDERTAILDQNRRDLRTHLEFARLFVAPELRVARDGSARIELDLLPDAKAWLRVDEVTLRVPAAILAGLGTPRASLEDPDGTERSVAASARVSPGDPDSTLSIALGEAFVWTPVDRLLALAGASWRLAIDLPGLDATAWRGPGAVAEVAVRARNTLSEELLPPHRLLVSAPIDAFEQRAGLPEARDVRTFVRASGLPFRIDGRTLVLAAGEHDVTRDLVLPAGWGLRLRAGTTLRLGPGVSLVVYGPVRAEGRPGAAVRISALGPRPFGSFAIVRAGPRSELRHFNVSGGSEARINGLFLSGQLAVHAGDVLLEDCRIHGAMADDGLNVKRGHVEIRRCTFHDNRADAFDGDWVEGAVFSSRFLRNGGDGIDLSGSRLAVHDCVLEGMGDKAMSVGERSEVLVYDSVLRDSATALASKDLSRSAVYASLFYGNGTALAVYRKKPIFGGGHAMVVGSLFWGNERLAEVDEESTVVLESSGVDRFEETRGVRAEGLIHGDPSRSFRLGPDGVLVLSEAAGSAYRIVSDTEPAELYDVRVPNLRGRPVGPGVGLASAGASGR